MMQVPRRTFALAMWPALFLALAASALAGPDDCKAFLESIFKNYQGKDAKGMPITSAEEFGKYFDEDLTRLYVKDREEAKGEVPRLDVDPFLDAQDFDLKSFKVDIASKDKRHATGTVALTNFDEHDVATFDLVKTSKGWRISNVHWATGKQSLRDILTGKSR